MLGHLDPPNPVQVCDQLCAEFEREVMQMSEVREAEAVQAVYMSRPCIKTLYRYTMIYPELPTLKFNLANEKRRS